MTTKFVCFFYYKPNKSIYFSLLKLTQSDSYPVWGCLVSSCGSESSAGSWPVEACTPYCQSPPQEPLRASWNRCCERLLSARSYPTLPFSPPSICPSWHRYLTGSKTFQELKHCLFLSSWAVLISLSFISFHLFRSITQHLFFSFFTFW